MGKIDDYRLSGVKHGRLAELTEFKDEVREIINYGKIGFPVVAAVPAWNAQEGEMAFYNATATTDRRIYVRLSSAWTIFGTPGTATIGDSEGAIQYNSSGFLQGVQAFRLSESTSALIITNSASLQLGLVNVLPNNLSNTSAVFLSAFSGAPGVSNSLIITPGNGGTYNSIGWGMCINGITPVVASSFQDFVVRANTSNIFTCFGIRGAGGFGGSELGFGDSSQAVVMRISYDNTSFGPLAGNTFRSGPTLKMVPAALQWGAGNSGAYFHVECGLVSLAGGWEMPWGIFGGSFGTDGIQQAAIDIVHPTAGTTSNLVSQRSWVFLAPAIGGPSASYFNSVSNATTVYIDQAPTFGAGSIQLISRYALWADAGDTRLDGNLLDFGGNYTQRRVGGAFFSLTSNKTITSTTAETALSDVGYGTTSLAANVMTIGKSLKIIARGIYSTALLPGTLRFRVSVGGTTILDTGANTPPGSASNLYWEVRGLISCQTTGGAGAIIGQGQFEHNISATDATFWQMANATTALMNTTATNIISTTVALSNTADSVTCTNLIYETIG